MNKKTRIYKNRRLLCTFALMLLIAATSLVAMAHINHVAEESCWNSLYDTAAALEDEIENKLKLEQMHMQMVADTMAKYDMDQKDKLVETMQLHLHGEGYTIQGMNILFPDDTVLRSDGVTISAQTELSFAEEAAKGVHVSDRKMSLAEPDKMVIRNFVPVEQNGETVAMLYGINDLAAQARDWKINAYDGQVAVYIVDTQTGDFIVDTWHDELGNISDMGNRQMKPGFAQNDLQDNMLQGETGYVAFLSETAGEYLYFYYEPLDINEWSLGVSVPESLVFARAENIRSTLYGLAVFEAVCFTVYFLWLLSDTKKETRSKQMQLEAVNHVYTVQRILFRAHHDPDAIVFALEQVAKVHGAVLASFEIALGEGMEEIYIWSSEKEMEQRIRASFEKDKFFHERFAAKMESVIMEDLKQCQCKLEKQERYQHLKEMQIYNLMEVPVCDASGNLVGILGVFNLDHVPESVMLLESVSLSFGLIYSNMRLFDTIREMGTMDFLTGVKNRNSYENEMAGYWKEKSGSLACVYADADGLHSLNNTHGHEAGDKMLCCIAEAYRNVFGVENCYRTGGDEFVAFAVNVSEEEVRRRMEDIRERVIAAGYHVSLGMQWAAEVHTAAEMDTLITDAEGEMFRDKEKYYETTARECRL